MTWLSGLRIPTPDSKSAEGVKLRRVTQISAVAAVVLFGGWPLPALAQTVDIDPEAKEPPPGEVQEEAPIVAAVLQGLDKITARISTFEAPIDEPVRFGSLEIVARTCSKTPPEEPPERAAFLEIVDVRPDSPSVALFTGWMFSSSPAISGIEHPVYDVWVVDCKRASISDNEASTGN